MNGHSALFKSPECQTRYEAAYHQTLEQWPVHYESIMVPTGAGSTHVIISGDEAHPPLLLVHMMSMSATMWYSNVEALSKNFRVFAVDVMHDLGKSVPARPCRTSQSSAQWLIDLFNELQIEQAHVVGASYGGWISINLAFHAPERIRRLALLAPAGSLKPLHRHFFLAMIPAVVTPSSESVRAAINALAGDQFEVDPLIVEQLRVGFKCRRPVTMSNMALPGVHPDRKLRRLSMPVLLLLGEKEIIYDVAQVVTRAERLIPHIETHILPDVGHGLSMENPAEINRRLLAFLS